MKRCTGGVSGKGILGKLYLVSTPIGNLEDITLRALRVLKEVDVIACESIKETRKLLSYYQIKKPLIRYFTSNEKVATERVVSLLKQGKEVALVSDRGTPAISDPGFLLVKECIKEGIDLEAIPGPSALITALSVSGLPPIPFLFLGFLPRKKKERRAMLEKVRRFSGTIVLYESPHRLLNTLRELSVHLGKREAVLARELTKVHQEIVRKDLDELILYLEEVGVKGECVLLIRGAEEELQVPENLEEEIKELISKGYSPSQTAKALAKKYPSLSRREIYSLVHRLISQID